jgi:uncharacterized protein YndB with AHSA1/START domain
MEVRSDRRCSFADDPSALWAKLVRTDDYRTWWPWLHRFEGGELVPGERWRCVVQPPLPYQLRFELAIDEVEPERYVRAEIGGDIEGWATIDLTPSVAGTELRLVSRLSPASSFLKVIARFAQPVVRYGHDWVLDAGLRQFRDATS